MARDTPWHRMQIVSVLLASMSVAVVGCIAPQTHVQWISERLPALLAAGKYDDAISLARRDFDDDDNESSIVRKQIAKHPGASRALVARLESEVQAATEFSDLARVTRSAALAERDGVIQATDGKSLESSISKRRAEFDSKRIAEQAEQERLRAENERREAVQQLEHERQLAEMARRQAEDEAEMKRLAVEAAKNNRFRCRNADQCRKAFSLAQIYVNEHSDMKIQLATDTIVETFNPTEDYKIGLRVIRTPSVRDTAEISISVLCKSCSATLMRKRVLLVEAGFAPYIALQLRD